MIGICLGLLIHLFRRIPFRQILLWFRQAHLVRECLFLVCTQFRLILMFLYCIIAILRYILCGTACVIGVVTVISERLVDFRTLQAIMPPMVADPQAVVVEPLPIEFQPIAINMRPYYRRKCKK